MKRIENTVVSVGRGTEFPFEVYGSPYLQGQEDTLYSDPEEKDKGSEETESSGPEKKDKGSENTESSAPEKKEDGSRDKEAQTYSFTFTPVSMAGAESPLFEGQTCWGRDLRQIPLDQILQEKIDLRYLVGAYRAVQEARPDISFFGTPDDTGRYWIDKLFGIDRIRKMIEEGYGAEEIERSWQEDVEAFREQRQKYLLYAE